MVCKCGATITFAINLASNKRVPLVPHDPAYPKAVRFRISEDPRYCQRDDDGPLMSHYANCPNANEFGKGKAKS